MYRRYMRIQLYPRVSQKGKSKNSPPAAQATSWGVCVFLKPLGPIPRSSVRWSPRSADTHTVAAPVLLLAPHRRVWGTVLLTFRTATGQLFRTAPDSAPDSVPDIPGHTGQPGIPPQGSADSSFVACFQWASRAPSTRPGRAAGGQQRPQAGMASRPTCAGAPSPDPSQTVADDPTAHTRHPAPHPPICQEIISAFGMAKF